MLPLTSQCIWASAQRQPFLVSPGGELKYILSTKWFKGELAQGTSSEEHRMQRSCALCSASHGRVSPALKPGSQRGGERPADCGERDRGRSVRGRVQRRSSCCLFRRHREIRKLQRSYLNIHLIYDYTAFAPKKTKKKRSEVTVCSAPNHNCLEGFYHHFTTNHLGLSFLTLVRY